MLEALGAFLLSPTGAALVVAILYYVYKVVIQKVPVIEELKDNYLGTVIAAVKFAEKQVPDDVENKAIAKLDLALKYVLDVYASREGMVPADNIANGIKELIQVVHSELEQNDQLHEPEPEAPKEETLTEEVKES
jgi:hypothetical protein